MSLSQLEKIKVNEVEVDFVALKFLINGIWQDVEARQVNLLKLLIENHGNAVSRNQIMDALWSDTVVSDNSVSQAITQLRKSLHDDKDTHRFIKTVPRIGYQLVAELTFFEPEEKIPEQRKKKQTESKPCCSVWRHSRHSCYHVHCGSGQTKFAGA